MNGSYILTVTAVDFCGNETVKSDWILNFDNETPKLVDASYDGYTHIGTDGNVYYGQNATAHQMQLTILEKNLIRILTMIPVSWSKRTVSRLQKDIR